MFTLSLKTNFKHSFINYRQAIKNNQECKEKLKEIMDYQPKLNESIKKHNKKVEKSEKNIYEFCKQMLNYDNMKGEKEKLVKLKNTYMKHKVEVIDSNNKQEKALKDIINQYQKDKNDSEARNKKIIDYKGCNIIIRKGDLTEEREDAIVNPTVEDSNHKGGTAKAIAEKGGEVIKKESEEYIKKYGNLPTGEATTTNSGNLPCEKVIHVVGPIYPQNSVRDEKQKEELRSAVKSILREMRTYEMNSVSLPAISTGVFPLDLCIVIFGNVLKKAIDSDPDFYKGKKLIICNFDNKTTNKMLELIPEYFVQDEITTYTKSILNSK